MFSDMEKFNSVSLFSVLLYAASNTNTLICFTLDVSLSKDIYICFTLDCFRYPIAKLSLASLGFSFMYLFYDNSFKEAALFYSLMHAISLL